jgi:flavin reductase (DIM6/NTAB) family NADH-FMN oxidoreductase RutF
MSSAFWLGWRSMLGFEAISKTPSNIIRTGECVLNLPSIDQVHAINRISMVTGSNPVPAGKTLRGCPGMPDSARSGTSVRESYDGGQVRLHAACEEC